MNAKFDSQMPNFLSTRPCSRLLSLIAVAALVGYSLTAKANLFQYGVTMSGPNESPANASTGTGSGEVDYNDLLHTLHVSFSFTGLSAPTTASHIHAPTLTPLSGTAGVATTTPYFAGFPIGVTSGSYDNTLDLTSSGSWNPSFISANGGTTAGAESALASAMASGKAYLNIHTTAFPGGEIRGFLLPVPEPSSLALCGLGGLALALFRRKTNI